MQSEVDKETYRAWPAETKAAVGAVDPRRRPVTWASSTTNDPAFDAVAAAYLGKPILITENGTWSVPGTHDSPEVEGSGKWQAEKRRKRWAQLGDRAQVGGYMFWVYEDYKQRCG
ncbi:hypothetical protein [Amycolatopsis sp. MtRt-6]|uniref:hypothetical protein n=1 Tax=Amycolatopsis sp. MtRt-6 TaxID=2792782 RepID=UPI001A8F5253|nr:hypothetical protein [Amycolatopsis sp. MtRt-6]